LRRWGPRTLDIDILAYGDQAIESPTLTVPHPRMFERAFVLVPLADIAGERVIGGRRVSDALSALDTSGIIRTDDLLSLPRAA
ncbi:2-amino-4-hydroxy-6-hydroxymethyldihydropteridine diphosphokinase, partial [Oceaniradius stylonematis]